VVRRVNVNIVVIHSDDFNWRKPPVSISRPLERYALHCEVVIEREQASGHEISDRRDD